MFAILETGGKQYRVEEGDILEVELLDKNTINKENEIIFDSVLLIQNQQLYVGQPYVKNSIIRAKILEEFKAPKIIVFKKKSKKGYKKKLGHRQMLHRIKIEEIQIDSAPQKVEKVPVKEKVDSKSAPQKTPKEKISPERKEIKKTTVKKKDASVKTQKSPRIIEKKSVKKNAKVSEKAPRKAAVRKTGQPVTKTKKEKK